MPLQIITPANLHRLHRSGVHAKTHQFATQNQNQQDKLAYISAVCVTSFGPKQKSHLPRLF
jgi:hypothetical protein